MAGSLHYTHMNSEPIQCLYTKGTIIPEWSIET